MYTVDLYFFLYLFDFYFASGNLALLPYYLHAQMSWTFGSAGTTFCCTEVDYT